MGLIDVGFFVKSILVTCSFRVIGVERHLQQNFALQKPEKHVIHVKTALSLPSRVILLSGVGFGSSSFAELRNQKRSGALPCLLRFGGVVFAPTPTFR
jgi:hypothetical protein